MREGQNLQRFFVDPGSINGTSVIFTEGVSHQISQVLRLDLNQDEVIVLDGRGKAYVARLSGRSGRTVTAEIIEKLEGNTEESVVLTLWFSLTRREKVEWILQKCTEIGVSKFQPYVSERSVNRLDSLEENRRLRWQTIIREAAEQSECSRLPDLLEVVSFDEVVGKLKGEEQGLIAYEGMDSTKNLRQLSLKRTSTILLIGPEGGFSDDEAEKSIRSGFQPFSLGKRILRMETACMVASALVLDRLDAIEVNCD